MTRWTRRLDDVTGGAARLPLLILFVLNIVDELDQVLYGAVAPNIRDTFGLEESFIIGLQSLAGAMVILLVVPVGYLADRWNRVNMTRVAAAIWGTMTVFTGISGFIGAVGLLFLARFGSGLGRVMNEPVHASLLADYYPPEKHAKVFSFHRLGNPIGAMLVLACALLADIVGWRLGFVLISIPTFIALTFLSGLKEPARGASLSTGMSALDGADEDEARVSFGEAWRRLKGIRTLQRTWWAGLLFGGAVIPISSIFAFYFESEYNVDSITARGAILMVYGVGSLISIEWGSKRATEVILTGDITKLPYKAGIETMVGVGLALIGLAIAPWIGLSIVMVFVMGVIGPGFISFHLPLVAAVAPPKLRSQAFAYFAFFFALGAVLMAAPIGNIGDDEGYRFALGFLAVVVIIAGFVYASAAKYAKKDAETAFNSMLAEAEAKKARAEGVDDQALLVCRGVEVAYDQVQVLFGVDMVVNEGEIVALLGTNGAGKSTLLKAISGIVDPIGGSVFLRGVDITHADAVETTKAGVVQVPGGKAVFPTLTVAEHLRAAGWLYRDDPDYLATANKEVLATFPRLEERYDQLAGNLSGGEQQMLALGMAFIAKPELLVIDELSLGLAPTIVEQLLGIVRRIQQQGTAIILVEQSINVALTVAERAYFLEKGEVRFEGLTAELMERDDIVRSVFLTGTAGDDDAPADKAEVRVKNRAPVGDKIVLELDAVTKRFGGITAVDDASFHLKEGEILGLIGPNGAGKTTIFDIISGFLIPEVGKITFQGTDITQMSPSDRAWLGLGRSFQDARLVPSLTVAENIAIGLERFLEYRDHLASALSLPAVLQLEDDVAWSVEDLVELMNLGAYRDKFVRELSTGSRRIVDLAMCIAHEPSVLLLDEPSSGIAQAETENLGPLMERIQRETGCAILVIEHDMPLITGTSDRMIALELGHPIAEGTPDEVISTPRVVSSYLGGDMATINRSGRPMVGTDGAVIDKTPRKPRRKQPLKAQSK